MALKTKPFEFARDIETEDEILDYLRVFLEENDIDGLVSALGYVAKKKGMTSIARKAGMNRQNLYRTLKEGGHPYIRTVDAVLRVMGLQLDVKKAS